MTDFTELINAFNLSGCSLFLCQKAFKVVDSCQLQSLIGSIFFFFLAMLRCPTCHCTCFREWQCCEIIMATFTVQSHITARMFTSITIKKYVVNGTKVKQGFGFNYERYKVLTFLWVCLPPSHKIGF